MTAMAKEIARKVHVRLGSRVTHLEVATAEWIAHIEESHRITSDALLLTPPVPQSLALLDAGNANIPSETREELDTIRYEKCITVMAVLNGPSAVQAPGGFAPAQGPVAWIADNQKKGISAVPAVTIQADANFSESHWNRNETRLEESLSPRRHGGSAPVSPNSRYMGGATVNQFM